MKAVMVTGADKGIQAKAEHAHLSVARLQTGPGSIPQDADQHHQKEGCRAPLPERLPSKLVRQPPANFRSLNLLPLLNLFIF
jgi:hypothetical protein